LRNRWNPFKKQWNEMWFIFLHEKGNMTILFTWICYRSSEWLNQLKSYDSSVQNRRVLPNAASFHLISLHLLKCFSIVFTWWYEFELI
jgi:hypothetical protein